jgi:hypothetical protein
MFPYWSGARERVTTLARTSQFRVAISAFFVVLHLLAFSKAGEDRLDLPFNSAPGESPYYSNPDASVVGGYPRQPHHWSRLIVSRWDSEIYQSFALRGMTACPEEPGPDETQTDQRYMECGLAWFPAFGEIAGTIAEPFNWPVDLVLFFMALVAAITVNLLWTSDTMIARLGLADTYLTLLAFNLFPTAFYLVAPYTEGTTLALVLGGFVCIANDRWIYAGILVGAATGLRGAAVAFAVGFGIAALVAAWQRYKVGKPWWRPIAGAALSGWGLIATLIVLQVCVGDWTAFMRARRMFGDDYSFGRLIDPIFYLRGFTGQHMDSVMLLGSAAIVALMWKHVRKLFKTPELTFFAASSAIGIALAIAAVHEYWGINRYLLSCPIIFLCTGQMARRHMAVFVMWLILCFAIYWQVELCSYISHGRPDVCPCLGRVEWWAPIRS